MVRRREVDDEGDDDVEAHTSTYSSAGKKSARTDLKLLDSEDTVLWYLTKLLHAIVYVCHARMVREDHDDDVESDA